MSMTQALKLYVQGGLSLIRQLTQGWRQVDCAEYARLDGCVGIVTGGSAGIGLQTAKALASLGMHVIIGSRTEEKGAKAIEDIKNACPNAIVDHMTVDTSSLASVDSFCEAFKQRNLPLSLLVNNAGVMLVPHRLTGDGVEDHMATNHLGHFAMTTALLPILHRSSTPSRRSRVVIVASEAHRRGSIDFEDMEGRHNYNPYGAYARSKLANVMHCRSLARKSASSMYPDVDYVSVHPGIVFSGLYRHLWWPLEMVYNTAAPWMLMSCEAGARTVVNAALANPVHSGAYFNCFAEESPHASAESIELQELLWDWSTQKVQQYACGGRAGVASQQ